MNVSHKHLTGIALVVFLCASFAHANAPASPFPLEKATEEESAYSALRLGNIAPLFALPDASGQLQTSTSALGTQSLLVLTLHKTNAAKSADNQWNPDRLHRLATALKDAAVRLEKAPVKIVVIVPADLFENLHRILGEFNGLNEGARLNLLRDDGQRWCRALDDGQSAVTIAAIDKAGFLRRLETGRDGRQLTAQLVEMENVTPPLVIGRAAPDWSVVDMNGHTRRLSDWRGHQNVVLTFFPKCFTGGCTNHLRSLNDVGDTFAQNDTQVIGVSFDSADGPHGQRAFAEQLHLSFPLIPDTGRNLALLYEAAVSPLQPVPARMTVLIDRQGIVRFIDRQVQTLTHGPDTVAKMRELKMIR